MRLFALVAVPSARDGDAFTQEAPDETLLVGAETVNGRDAAPLVAVRLSKDVGRMTTVGYFRRTGRTFSGEQLRQDAMVRRLSDPDVVGLIHRFDHDDILTESEAEHWDRNLLPFGWWIVSDRRRDA